MIAIPKEIDLIAKPVSFAMAELDARLPLGDVEKIKEALEKKKEPIENEVVVYKGAKHGELASSILGGG